MQFLVNAEGGLTTAGYAVSIVAAVILFLAAVFIAGKVSGRKQMGAKQLAFCAMAIALGFVTSYLKVFPMPFGGSITLFSMLFIVLPAYWYGPKTGILVGFTYGILQFLQEPYVLSLFQVCCDYFLAFAALGAAGFFVSGAGFSAVINTAYRICGYAGIILTIYMIIKYKKYKKDRKLKQIEENVSFAVYGALMKSGEFRPLIRAEFTDDGVKISASVPKESYFKFKRLLGQNG